MKSSCWIRFTLLAVLLVIFAVKGSREAESGHSQSKDHGKGSKQEGGKSKGPKRELEMSKPKHTLDQRGSHHQVRRPSQRRSDFEAGKEAELERKRAMRQKIKQDDYERRLRDRQERLEREERKRKQGLEAKSSQGAAKQSSSNVASTSGLPRMSPSRSGQRTQPQSFAAASSLSKSRDGRSTQGSQRIKAQSPSLSPINSPSKAATQGTQPGSFVDLGNSPFEQEQGRKQSGLSSFSPGVSPFKVAPGRQTPSFPHIEMSPIKGAQGGQSGPASFSPDVSPIKGAQGKQAGSPSFSPDVSPIKGAQGKQAGSPSFLPDVSPIKKAHGPQTGGFEHVEWPRLQEQAQGGAGSLAGTEIDFSQFGFYFDSPPKPKPTPTPNIPAASMSPEDVARYKSFGKAGLEPFFTKLPDNPNWATLNQRLMNFNEFKQFYLRDHLDKPRYHFSHKHFLINTKDVNIAEVRDVGKKSFWHQIGMTEGVRDH